MLDKELRKIIDNYRKKADEALLEDFRFVHNGGHDYYDMFDLNYWNRKNLILELYNNYTDEDKPLIKWLLKEEQKGFEVGIPVETNDICAFMLYKLMDLDDVYDLYNAKFGTGTDNQFFVDIELVFGFEREETKNYLRNKSKNKRLNKKILEAIEYYESHIKNGAIYRNRADYIQFYETKKISSIKRNLVDIENEMNNKLNQIKEV